MCNKLLGLLVKYRMLSKTDDGLIARRLSVSNNLTNKGLQKIKKQKWYILI